MVVVSAKSAESSPAKPAESSWLKQIDALHLSVQAQRLRKAYFDTAPHVASERARIAMDAWKESEGMPIDLRRAHLVKRILEEVPVAIYPDELTAGSETRFFRGVNPTVDHDPSAILEQLQRGTLNLQTDVHFARATAEDLDVIGEASRYFLGKTGPDLVRDLRHQVMGTWWDDLMQVSGSTPFEAGHIQAGVLVYEKVLKSGLEGFIREAESKISRFATLTEDDPEKLLFWKASITCCQAIISFARRYAELAEGMARKEADPERARRLERMAQACRWVPENPPRTFFEALQSVRLVHLASKLEGTFSASAGRVDQYLYPYFAADLAAGRLSLPEALDLLSDFFSYLGRQDWVFEIKNAQNVQASSAIVNITVAGVTSKGEDACNELTYLLLHAAGLLKYAQPQLTFRLNRITPRAMMMKALETNYRVGGGVPQFHNDEHVIEYLMDRGAAIEDARDWCVFGCSEPHTPKCRTLIRGMYPNIALAVDLALHNGIAPKSGKRVGLETGDPRAFATFQELYDAVKRQAELIIRGCARQHRFALRIWSQRFRAPLTSTLLPGCLEKGKDLMVGGQADNSLVYLKDRGIVNAADSLMAVKKLVFEDKRLSMAELLEALDGDFAGTRGEEIRRLCVAAPKYGNEDSEADAMVRELAKFTSGIIYSENNAFGQPYAINRNGVGWHYYGGKGVGALPDGRKKGEPLADGSLSPMRGTEKKGPTAVVNSALAADYKETAIAILNMRFPKNLAHSPEAQEKLAALTNAYILNGGLHIQYNLLDHKILLEAKKHPEKFRDLVVRVAGYSAYFVDLAGDVQDEIIRRTQQAL